MDLLDLLVAADIPAILAYDVPYRQNSIGADFIEEWTEEWGTSRCLDWFVAQHPMAEQLRKASRTLTNYKLPRGLGFLSYMHRPARNMNIARRHLISATREQGGLDIGILTKLRDYYRDLAWNTIRDNDSRVKEFYYYLNQLFLGSIADGTGHTYLTLDAIKDVYESHKLSRILDPDGPDFLAWKEQNGVPTVSSVSGESESGDYPESMLSP
jgi:hypothetical protein